MLEGKMKNVLKTQFCCWLLQLIFIFIFGQEEDVLRVVVHPVLRCFIEIIDRDGDDCI